MPDDDGGIYLAVNKKAQKVIFKRADVMLHLTRRQCIQLVMLLNDATDRGSPGMKAREQ